MMHYGFDVLDGVSQRQHRVLTDALATEAAHAIYNIARTLDLGQDTRDLRCNRCGIYLWCLEQIFQVLHSKRYRVQRLPKLVRYACGHLSERRHLGGLRHLRLLFPEEQRLPQEQRKPIGEIDVGGSKPFVPLRRADEVRRVTSQRQGQDRYVATVEPKGAGDALSFVGTCIVDACKPPVRSRR